MKLDLSHEGRIETENNRVQAARKSGTKRKEITRCRRKFN